MHEPNDVKSTWHVHGEEQPPAVHHVTMLRPSSAVCNGQCPWLLDNHGTTVQLLYDHEVPGLPSQTEFTYSPWKRSEIWDSNLKGGVCGYGSLCHVRLPGTQLRDRTAWDVVSRQCSGALVMQQREVLRHVERGESALTLAGAARVATDMLGREVAEDEVRTLDLGVLLAHAHPSLLDSAIGSDAVAPLLSEPEIERWRRLR